ncbi:ATP-binding protein [Granulimonas faecalis]|uniref:ATP-binding protein n=1 Tax=Granulimonas faecalis TaxID=2894155 RepID=UPI003514A6B5
MDQAEIPSAETIAIEFKRDKSLPKNVIYEEVVALANSGGGDLYLGVEDNGEISGADPHHRNSTELEAQIGENTIPCISVRVEILDTEPPVAHISVPSSPVIYATRRGKVLRRRTKADGSPETVPFYPYEYNSRLSDMGKLDYTAQLVPELTVDDFDETEIERLRNSISKSQGGDRSLLDLTPLDLLSALRLLQDGTPTVAGLLIVGKPEVIARHLPASQSVFHVLVGTEARINEDLPLPIIAAVDRASQLFSASNAITEVEDGVRIIRVPDFDSQAFREGLINAFSHRDYTMLGQTIVKMDSEGLTISNPGGFIEGITLKNLLNASPRSRNPLLADVLKRAGLAEKMGRGIDRIFEGSAVYGKPLPDYSLTTQREVNLFIARSEPDRSFMSMVAELGEKRSISLAQLMVLDTLRQDTRATAAEIDDELDLGHERARSVLERLVAWGAVEAHGEGNGRTYLLDAHYYKRAGRVPEHVRQVRTEREGQKETILRLAAEQGSVTTRGVSELLHVGTATARRLIRQLENAGKLVKHGSTRDTVYRLP